MRSAADLCQDSPTIANLLDLYASSSKASPADNVLEDSCAGSPFAAGSTARPGLPSSWLLLPGRESQPLVLDLGCARSVWAVVLKNPVRSPASLVYGCGKPDSDPSALLFQCRHLLETCTDFFFS